MPISSSSGRHDTVNNYSSNMHSKYISYVTLTVTLGVKHQSVVNSGKKLLVNFNSAKKKFLSFNHCRDTFLPFSCMADANLKERNSLG